LGGGFKEKPEKFLDC